MSLIEGLPDAIALQCLARLPLGMHRTLRAVCRAWRCAVSSGSGSSGRELFRLRAHLGLVEEWLYVTSFEPDRVWEAYDPSSDTWHTLPDFPSPVRHLSNFATAAVAGNLFVLGGGSDDVDVRTGDRDYCAVAISAVWCFDAARGTWHSRAPMATARTQFACAALSDGRILVAGGFGSSRRPLATAELYDPLRDTWQPAGDLAATHNSSCSAYVLHGTPHLLHKGVAAVQAYDPKLDRWSLVDSWGWEFQGPSAVVGGGDVYTVASASFYVLRGVQQRQQEEEEERRREQQVCRMMPEYLHRIGFGVAAIGSEVYVVGGILGPRPDSGMIQVLRDIDIWNVDGDFLERRGTRMSWCVGTVLGCAVVGL